MSTPIVTANWLKDNLTNPNLIILDGSLTNNTAGIESKLKDQQIIGAKYFDIQKDYSLKETELVSMLITPEAFQEKVRKLGVNKDSKIIVYDTIGTYSSPRVKWMFNVMGFDNIAVLDGGLPSWIAQEFPTEPKSGNTVATKLGNFESKVKSELTTTLDQIKESIGSESKVILDARSSGRFNGTSPEPRPYLKSGHIPTSINLPFEKVLHQGKFKSKKELVQIFKGLNLEDKYLIFTCGSGITACIILLAAEIAGYKNLSLFDGSWVEWAINN